MADEGFSEHGDGNTNREPAVRGWTMTNKINTVQECHKLEEDIDRLTVEYNNLQKALTDLEANRTTDVYDDAVRDDDEFTTVQNGLYNIGKKVTDKFYSKYDFEGAMHIDTDLHTLIDGIYKAFDDLMYTVSVDINNQIKLMSNDITQMRVKHGLYVNPLIHNHDLCIDTKKNKIISLISCVHNSHKIDNLRQIVAQYQVVKLLLCERHHKECEQRIKLEFRVLTMTYNSNTKIYTYKIQAY